MDSNGTEGVAAPVDEIKPEIKAEFEPDFKVKEEAENDAEGTGKRARKSKVASMAELSGSEVTFFVCSVQGGGLN